MTNTPLEDEGYDLLLCYFSLLRASSGLLLVTYSYLLAWLCCNVVVPSLPKKRAAGSV